MFLPRINYNVFKDVRFLLLFFFVLHLFLRFYQLEQRAVFGYDQVDSAWAAKHIIVDHQYPLAGPANKLGSGLFVGPLYYYLISIVYYFTQLDPIAAGIFAGLTSILGFFVIYTIGKKIFSPAVGLIAIFINTVSYSGIEFDRIQWEINFVPIVSLLAFYFLYKIINGSEKSIIWLSLILALSFHVHMTTSVFLPLIALASLPFFPRNKKTLRYIFLSLPIIILGLSPILIANIQSGNIYAANSLRYADSSFHGIHLTRFLQLKNAAFIQLEFFFTFPILRFLSLLILLIFFLTYFLNIPSRKTFSVTFLVFMWYFIPWIVLTGFSGEITDYYFSTNRYIGLLIMSYLIWELVKIKKIVIILFIICFVSFYSFVNIQRFTTKKIVGLSNYRALVLSYIKEDRVIQFKEGDPVFYLYYLYTQRR